MVKKSSLMNRVAWILQQQLTSLPVWVSGLLLMAFGSANAFDIPTGNEDLKLRWDNTFRYTLGQRLKGQDRAILNSPNNDDGDRNFNVGIVSNRLDVLSEMDAVYKEDFGIRISGAGWYDTRYREHLDNTSAFTSNHLVNGNPEVGLNNYVKRKYAGPNGELLDAFAFGKTTIGDVPVSMRVGRHTIYWGESMLPSGGTHGISYAQSPIDLGKALAQPGVELKEIFRPLNQVSVQVQPIPTLTIAGQYYLQWEPSRFPEAGTYFGFADPFLSGGESIFAGPGLRILNGGDIEPKQAHDWGISARWSPEWLDGTTMGVYYRNFSDKLPQLHMDGSAGPAALPNYRLVYASDIDLYGISIAKQILGASIGGEVSIRQNMPLVDSGPLVGIPGSPLPGRGDTAGARGDTFHSVVNALFLINKTPLFDSASVLTEFTYARYLNVTSGKATFKGNPNYTGIDRVTRDNMTGAINFAPQWLQIIPGVDLTMPLSIATGLFGNSAVSGGGAKNNGSYSAGLNFDILARYAVNLAYAGFFGTYQTDATGGISSAGDVPGLLKDRDLLSLTLKASF
jgi:hypothetical protein